jgi:hypothetical protein
LQALQLPGVFASVLSEAARGRELSTVHGCAAFHDSFRGRASGEQLRRLRARLEREGCLVVQEVDWPKGDETHAFAAFISALGIPTNHSAELDDPIWEISPLALGTRDLSSSRGAVPLHTDSSFKPRPERFIALLALRNDGRGGESHCLSVDRLLDDLVAHAPGRDCLEVLSRVPVPTLPPPVFGFPRVPRLHPVFEATPRMRYRRDLIALALQEAPVPELHDSLRYLASAVDESTHRQEHRLAQGSLLLVDNHRFLHGRAELDRSDRLLLRMRFN